MSSSSQAYMHIATYEWDNNKQPQRIPGGTRTCQVGMPHWGVLAFRPRVTITPMIPLCNRTWPTGQRSYRDHEVKCNLTKSSDMLSYRPSRRRRLRILLAQTGTPWAHDVSQGAYPLFLGFGALNLQSGIFFVASLLIYHTVWSLNAKAQCFSDARRRIMTPGSLG